MAARKTDRCAITLQLIHWGVVLPGLTMLLLAVLVRMALNPEPKWALTTASQNATMPSGNTTTPWGNDTTPSENATIANLECTLKFAIGVVTCLVFFEAYKVYQGVVSDVLSAFWHGGQSVMLLQNVPELQAAPAARF
ncbi:hypothetical protein MRX96_000574 [Rhipicephalus microplus]